MVEFNNDVRGKIDVRLGKRVKIVGFRVVESLAIPMQKCSDFRTKKKKEILERRKT